MRLNMKWTGRTVILPLIGLSLGSILALTVLFGSGVRQDISVSAQAEPRTVYLPDTARPTVNPQEARGRGILVASSAADLKSAASSADAFIIDSSQLAAVAAGDWLRAQRMQGRIIVALNTPIDELERAAGSPFDQTGPFRQNWQRVPFYSYVFESPPGRTPHYEGRGSDVLSGLDSVLRVVRLGHQQVTGTYSPPQNSSPTPQP